MKIFRKRYVPDEIVDISGDEVVRREDNLIVTKWLPIHPRPDMSGGMSWTYFKDGYKISKIYGPEGEFKFYYCDIIDYSYDEAEDSYIFTDLLVDVKVYLDGSIKFLDFDELQEAFDNGTIDDKIFSSAITKVSKLITLIQSDSIESLCIL